MFSHHFGSINAKCFSKIFIRSHPLDSLNDS